VGITVNKGGYYCFRVYNDSSQKMDGRTCKNTRPEVAVNVSMDVMLMGRAVSEGLLARLAAAADAALVLDLDLDYFSSQEDPTRLAVASGVPVDVLRRYDNLSFACRQSCCGPRDVATSTAMTRRLLALFGRVELREADDYLLRVHKLPRFPAKPPVADDDCAARERFFAEMEALLSSLPPWKRARMLQAMESTGLREEVSSEDRRDFFEPFFFSTEPGERASAPACCRFARRARDLSPHTLAIFKPDGGARARQATSRTLRRS
jgi:hypothetical protein